MLIVSYRLVLGEIELERILYLTVPSTAYQSFFQGELPKASVKRHNVKIMVYDPRKEEILKWIN
ncbi:MAG TPA: XisH protein [Cyanobacteria bacterium UBA12227]|nr:XisH protein [Cyanobacteria bacterium UBA12227]HAX87496.1 XisH protein [Cyanobacteria bacterium UBA11370]HBY78242.1 XisH protein [Cyanobacteria bacterium UBA11148]